MLLLYGAFLFGSPALLAALNRQRFLSLAVGIAAYAVLYVFFVDGMVRPVISPKTSGLRALVGAQHHGLAVRDPGFANRYLTRRPAFLAKPPKRSTRSICCIRP